MNTSWKLPPPPDQAVYHGLAGDFVRHVIPHTESDEVALLGQFLAAFGSAIGRTAHFQVEGDPQYLNFYLGVVGESSGGSKGASWKHVKRCFDAVAGDWAQRRVIS